MSDAFERSARFWLRAYPVRWRSVRGDELVATLSDLAGPGATRLAAREALGLVRGGWATRWREGPPLHVRLGYTLLGTKVPPQWREWARDDIAGRWYGVRRAARGFSLILPMVLIVPWALDGSPPNLVPALLVFGGAVLMGAIADLRGSGNDRIRRVAAKTQLLPRLGEPALPGGFGAGRVARRRMRAVPGAAVVLATALVTGAIATVTTLLTPIRPAFRFDCGTACLDLDAVPYRTAWFALPAGVALLVGTVVAVVARRRWRRWTPARPPQPWRWPGSGRHVWDWVAVGVLIPVLATMVALIEVGGDVFPPVLSALLALTCLVALPALVAALTAAVRGPADLTCADLWQMGAHGRAPLVDEPDVAVVRVPVEPSPPAAR